MNSVMLHPRVLECFGATLSKNPGVSAGLTLDQALSAHGFIELHFPSIGKAAQWVSIWEEQSGKEPPVSLTSYGSTFNRPVRVTVHDWGE
jgi:hypothetical protein